MLVKLKDKEKWLKRWRGQGHVPESYCHAEFHCVECSKCGVELIDDLYILGSDNGRCRGKSKKPYVGGVLKIGGS